MDQLMDNNIVRVIVHNTDEEYELEEKSRSKMSQVEYCKPYDYSKAPHISKSFDPSREIPEKSWYVTESYVSSSNGAPVTPVAQVNGPLPSSGTVTPLPTRCRVLDYFKTFMKGIENLENVIEHHSEIKIATFQSAYEREKRDIFQKQFLPLVQNLRHCATRWEQELQKEVKEMQNIFALNENAILIQQRKNRFLKTDSDRLLEKILTADIYSITMNDLYYSSNATVFENYCADIDLLNKENDTMKQKYETLRQNSDDVKNKLSNEICQLKQRLEWCQAQSLETELQLQSQNVSKSCQLCKDNVFLQNKCQKLRS
jgi:hypothetical protein